MLESEPNGLTEMHIRLVVLVASGIVSLAMAQASSYLPYPPDPQDNPGLTEILALRARCARLQTERDRFKDALWNLRANFSALQTHAEALELENAELRDNLSMRADVWRFPHAFIPQHPALDTPGAQPFHVSVASGSGPADADQGLAGPSLDTTLERENAGNLEGPSLAPGSPPQGVTGTPISSSPPEAENPSTLVIPNLPLNHSSTPPVPQTLIPVTPPPSEPKKGKAKANPTAKRQAATTATVPKPSSPKKRKIAGASSSGNSASPSKRTRIQGTGASDIRSLVSLPEGTDSSLKAQFDSMIGTSSTRMDTTAEAVNNDDAADTLPTPTSSNTREDPHNSSISRNENPESAATQPVNTVLVIETAATTAPSPAAPALTTHESTVGKPTSLEPTIQTPQQPHVATSAPDPVVIKDPPIPSKTPPAPRSSTSRASTKSGAVESTSHSLRSKTHWDPSTGKRIQVGPPRGKPREGEAKRLVISIRPKSLRNVGRK